MKRIGWWSILLILLLCPACGYQLTAQQPLALPQDSTRLFLSKVSDPTTETWLEPMLRSSLRDELTRRGKVTWVDQDEAQALVTIDVRQYSFGTAVEGRDSTTVKSSAQIHLVVSFYNAQNNAMIWTSGPIMASESFRGAENKQAATQRAVILAMRMVADRMSYTF